MISGDDELTQLFIEEANELLADAEQALLRLESQPDDLELLNRIFRCAHTLKGNAKMLGFEGVASFTHQLENLLDKLRKQELKVTPQLAQVVFSSVDVMKGLIAGLSDSVPQDQAVVQAVEASIAALVEPLSAQLPAPPPLALRPANDALPTPQLSLHAPKLSLPAPKLSSHAPVELPPVEQPRFEPLKADEPATPLEGKKRAPEAEASSVRVPIEKLDRLVNLTGEVVIAQSMIAQLVSDLEPDRAGALQELVGQLGRHCRELQERVLGARMLPIKGVFGRFTRLVRDMSTQTGKAVVLETHGDDVELDKTVIEKIADPLTHLVRNALDHGMELPDARIAAGKPAQGTLTLAAFQKGGSIFVTVSDDGRGLDRAKILHKARSLGLAPAHTELSDDDVFAFIFHPGFSTADKVTEISGRGVGMDVVRRNIEALKGTIGITTMPGRGTTFSIKLPLTLAILDGLGLRVGDETYLLPLVAVVESLKPSERDIHHVAGSGEVLEVRGEYLPLLRLYQLLDSTPLYARASDGLVIVVDDGLQKLALQVDELIGQYQVVIKSLEDNLSEVRGVSGATVLGDGRVALILDVSNLRSIARGHPPPLRLAR
jgi:two-component system chemotaxis sensor kinase CheA